MSPRFRIKICGVTSVADALLAARAGADAVGLNFYPRSPRVVTPAQAAEIAALLPAGVVKVGLFVNADPPTICRTFDGLGLDLIQLHGDEPPDLLSQLGGRPVMRAFRLGPSGLAPVVVYLDTCRRVEAMPDLVLIDTHVPGKFGGTGVTADWSALAGYPPQDWLPPLVLAGGLVPDNVAEAIRTVRPAAVDTASGVESGPGRKSEDLVRRFVQAAREAFARL